MRFVYLASFLVLLFMPLSVVSSHEPAVEARARVAEIVESVERMPQLIRRKIATPFEDDARQNVEFFPKRIVDAEGVPVGMMDLDGRRAVHGLLRSVLSQEGYLLVNEVMALEEVLRHTGSFSAARLSDDYFVQLFGAPTADAPWAFKFEGHHLSLNVTVVGSQLRATPLFLGASPAEVRSGPRAGLRVLGRHEDLARALVGSLSRAQLEKAHDLGDPRDGIIQRGTPVAAAQNKGIVGADLSEDQRALLLALIETYAHTLAGELSDEAIRRVRESGLKGVRFRWLGSLESGGRYYYRVEGPTMILEFDMLADCDGCEPNHIHSLWTDPERDFGKDLLREHYEKHHQP